MARAIVCDNKACSKAESEAKASGWFELQRVDHWHKDPISGTTFCSEKCLYEMLKVRNEAIANASSTITQ